MKKLLVIFFTAFAINASAQNIITDTPNDSIYADRISLKELSKITHTTDAEGTPVLKTQLFNGAEYTLKTSDIVSTSVLTAKESIAQGRFKDMTFYKDFDSLEEFSSGDLIGILDEQDYTLDEFVAAAYTDLFGMEALFQNAVKVNMAAFALSNFTTTNNIQIHVANIVYASKDKDGQIIPLSGRLIYPYSTTSRQLNIQTVYVDHHTTLFDNNTSPSLNFVDMPLCGMVGKGYYVVEPDLIGFGVSTDRTQMYIDSENNPRNAADCVLAAMHYAEMSKTDLNMKPVNLTSNVKMINAGGSQGGYTALAMEKYIENEMPEDEVAQLPAISKNVLYGVPSDPVMTLEKYAKLDTLRMSVALPMLVQGAVIAHPEMMVYDDGTPISVHDFFIPELRTRTWNFKDYNINKDYTIWQLQNSKHLTVYAFIWALCSTWGALVPTGYEGVTYGYLIEHKVMADGTLNCVDGQYSLNKDDQRIKALCKVLDRYILADNNRWVPKADIELTHGEDDRWVDYQNSVELVNNMKEPMNAEGHTITLETLSNTLSLGGHGVVCYMWMLGQLLGIDTNTVLDIIRGLQDLQQ